MKVGIITIIDNDNYGNRLQNYATTSFLKQMGVEVETIYNDARFNSKSRFIVNKIKKIFKEDKKSLNVNRIKKFDEFNGNIVFSLNSVNAFTKLDNYDYVIVGSDQVWNPNFGRLRYVDLLKFIDSKKRISFSASFGVSDIPRKLKYYAGRALKQFKAISVREDTGKKIVEEISERSDIEVLVDPTMLLTAEDWDKVSKKPVMLKCKKYILNYFLGSLSEKRMNEIKRIAEENDCEIINILDKKSSFYECGPSEFLYLEKNAFLICTDSFHSSVFAILYDVPFLVFNREDSMLSMNSRIETLISKFKLKNRIYNGEKIVDENLNHDYTEAYKILSNERKKSEKFIRNALEIKE